MVGQVWIELRYGVGGQGLTLCKSQHPPLLQAFKQEALERASRLAQESKRIDKVVYLQDKAEVERLQKLLPLLIPEDGGGAG